MDCLNVTSFDISGEDIANESDRLDDVNDTGCDTDAKASRTVEAKEATCSLQEQSK